MKKKSFGWLSYTDRLNRVEKFTSKSKEAWKKTLPSGWQQNLKCILQVLKELFSENFEAIKRFVVTSHVPKSCKITDLAEGRWLVFQKCRRFRERKVKMENRKISRWENFFPQKGHFFNTTHHVNTQEHGWKPSNEDLISIATEDDIVPELLLTVCGCKSSNCSKRSCKSCHKFCENIDPKEILGDDSSDVEGDIDDEERKNEE